MAYINKEEVKAIRDNFKKEFSTKQGWKFSISGENYSNVNVVILKSPMDLSGLIVEGRDYHSIAEYNIAKDYGTELAPIFERMFQLVKTENYFDKSDSMTDYFHCSHYYSISIGSWIKPYMVKESLEMAP